MAVFTSRDAVASEGLDSLTDAAVPGIWHQVRTPRNLPSRGPASAAGTPLVEKNLAEFCFPFFIQGAFK